MAKGIIVVEMPERCADCQLIAPIPGCPVTGKSIYREVLHNKKPDWCPISPVPRVNSGERKYLNEYEKGWNDCVDYLEGRNGED